MKRVCIERFNRPEDLAQTLARALEWLDVRSIISQNSRVFIKPNLTWRVPTPGVTVTPAFLRALVECLLPLTPHIIIGESEGGQACFLAEDAFRNHGLYTLEKEYGVGVINLSKLRHEEAAATIAGKSVVVQLPALLLDQVDVFISVPVPKVHAMTGVSIGLKNQWGCLGDRMRVTLHPRFAPTVLAVNKLLKPRLCICDGTFFLDCTGPMMGEAVPMNLVVAGNDIGATSLACCELMKIRPMKIAHYRLARKEGMFPKMDEVELNRSPSDFCERQFRLRRSSLNYIHLLAFKNRLINRFFYDSIFADFLHEVLWLVRRNQLISRILYGKYGPGEARRGGSAA
jgi:uncharacterized protein (DUF362 family)